MYVHTFDSSSFRKEELIEEQYSCSYFERHLIRLGYNIERRFLDQTVMLVDNLDYFIDKSIYRF